ncbi:hypothetical protein T484DRAFT_1978868 [Baffinella frigidus]|nr:hypothetical protein T484DRAFT_1978868 [Cryptophyta sp. CCMP2293]
MRRDIGGWRRSRGTLSSTATAQGVCLSAQDGNPHGNGSNSRTKRRQADAVLPQATHTRLPRRTE